MRMPQARLISTRVFLAGLKMAALHSVVVLISKWTSLKCGARFLVGDLHPVRSAHWPKACRW